MSDTTKELNNLLRTGKRIAGLSMGESNKLIQELGRNSQPDTLRTLKGVFEGAIVLADQLEEDRLAAEKAAKEQKQSEISRIAELLRSFPHGQKLSERQLIDAAESMYDESLKAGSKPKRKPKVKNARADQTVDQKIHNSNDSQEYVEDNVNDDITDTPESTNDSHHY